MKMRRRLFALVAVLCLLSSVADAQIALDTSLSGQAGGAGPNSFSYTTTGSNIVLGLGCLSDGSTTCTATYDGVAFSAVNHSTPVSGYTAYALCLALGAGRGAKTLVVTGGTGNSDMYVVAADYTGAAQNCPSVDGSTTFSDGLGSPFAVTWTTVANNAWQLAWEYDDAATAMTAGASTTKRQANGFAGFALFDSGGPRTPAGSNSLNLNANSIGGGITGAAFSLAPASGPACTPTLSLLGVGRCGD